jgi:hypothetical protein
MGGLKINIGKYFFLINYLEWSKKSKKYDPDSTNRPPRRE